jgi:hypothetical protein
MRIWDAIVAVGIKIAELREKFRKDPAYRPACKEDCQEQHIHMGYGQLFWAPASTEAPTNGWDGWISLGATTEGYRWPPETGDPAFDAPDDEIEPS